MRIAILLDDIFLSETRTGIKHIFLFEQDGGLVMAIGEELMRINNINYVCLWLLGKRVKEIYYDAFTASEKSLLMRLGLIIRPFDEIKKNPLLQALLIKQHA